MNKVSHIFAATVLAGLGVMYSQSAFANDQDVLTQGYCGPTAEINQARKEAGLKFVFGGEAGMLVYNDNGEAKTDENGDPVIEEKEYLMAANKEGDWYTFMGNADLDGTSTKFCVGIAGEGLRFANNTDTPQTIPYPTETVKQEAQRQLDHRIPSYVVARGKGAENDLMYTLFATSVADADGKNWIMYSHKTNESRAWTGGGAGRIFPFGNKLAEKYRKDMHASM